MEEPEVCHLVVEPVLGSDCECQQLPNFSNNNNTNNNSLNNNNNNEEDKADHHLRETLERHRQEFKLQKEEFEQQQQHQRIVIEYDHIFDPLPHPCSYC